MIVTAAGLFTAATAPARSEPNPAAVDRAFTALETYNPGASRAALAPLDDAAVASLVAPAARSALELRLIGALEKRPSPVAAEYLCGKLALIGTRAAVPVLAALLADRERAEPARNALELMPCAEAVQALRQGLAKLEGTLKIGVIHSLGVRRDVVSVPELGRMLRHLDEGLAGAVASALGRIGNAPAAVALRESLGNVAADVRPLVADACLACAEQLASDHGLDEARRLYRALQEAAVADHVRAAAERGLARLG
jgi:HEAT repeat protein